MVQPFPDLKLTTIKVVEKAPLRVHGSPSARLPKSTVIKIRLVCSVGRRTDVPASAFSIVRRRKGHDFSFLAWPRLLRRASAVVRTAGSTSDGLVHSKRLSSTYCRFAVGEVSDGEHSDRSRRRTPREFSLDDSPLRLAPNYASGPFSRPRRKKQVGRPLPKASAREECCSYSFCALCLRPV